jgi:hypothetical protein
LRENCRGLRRWPVASSAESGLFRSLALQAVVGMAVMVPDDEDGLKEVFEAGPA